MSSDESVHEAIRRLVGEEQKVRAEHAEELGDPAAQVRQLRELEAELDQCWDLLRQRRALRAAGGNPETATVRPATQVQTYRQ